jgi:hypothetical protein
MHPNIQFPLAYTHTERENGKLRTIAFSWARIFSQFLITRESETPKGLSTRRSFYPGLWRRIPKEADVHYSDSESEQKE